ncbi:MAG: LysM peptidoglycan-binding domain-containing protein [bacterium]|nr:LysM peptidoglycan-binding domain-containing protein [bacterium]
MADFIKKHRTIRILHILRNYSALMVVVSSSLLVTSTNLANGSNSNGFLSGYFNNSAKNKESLRTSSQESRKDNLAFVPLAKAPSSVDPNFKEADNNDKLALVSGQSLTASFGTSLKDPEEEGGVKIYEVQSGDTVSGIAARYKITVNTILWANDIDNVDSIMPGDKIFILPVAGLSYTVKPGDSIDLIANKYKADRDKIISFNSLPANGELREGDEIVIPDGQKETPQLAQNNTNTSQAGIVRRQYATSSGGTPTVSSGWKTLGGKAGAGHKFPYGYCTWYVAQRRYVPWGGNAGTWLYHAKSAGYRTGKTPQVGAIMVSSESWWGHVAIVESVSGGSFTVSEMNYKGWGKTSRRVISTSSRAVKGFIY